VKNRFTAFSILRFVAVLIAVAAVTGIDYSVFHVNSPTAALSYLLLILALSTRVGLAEAVLASIASMLTYNFYFLPPIGTLTIADPQNWVALVVFLITAITASHLSSSARRKATEAEERQRMLENLYEFSRRLMLGDTDLCLPDHAIRAINDLFQPKDVCIYDPETGSTRRTAADSELTDHFLRETAEDGWSLRRKGDAVAVPVRFGGRLRAVLGIEGAGDMPEVAVQAVAQLLGIGLERARAQQEATRAEAARENERLKSILLDALAHEFKTPLTAIKASTSTLLSRRLGDEAERELVTVVDEEADRLTNLVSDSIELARMGSGPVVLDRDTESVLELVNNALNQLRGLLQGRELRVDIPDDLPDAYVDKKLTELAFRQILDNACRYSPEDTPIDIGARAKGAMILVSFKNTGPGIPAGEQSLIFEKFYRSQQARGRVAGSGLGLAIVRDIVEAHGGNVWVESEPGRGTTFSLAVPAATEQNDQHPVPVSYDTQDSDR
jgi:two-component system sensor histidine kinase KdpD